MKKLSAILFAALLAFVPLSAQATAERPIISISNYEEWLAAGVQNGWVVNSQIVQRDVQQPQPQAEVLSETEDVQRAPSKGLVIIDAYFDSSKISGPVVDICIAELGCELTPTPVSGVASEFNHGTAMAEIARKANPDVTLYLVRAASSFKVGKTDKVNMTYVNGKDFLKALDFVKANQDKVAAMSFSYNIGAIMKPGECKLSNHGATKVSEVDPKIRAAISELKTAGIPVFASTGNDRNKKPVAYPACISDVMSVASGVGNSYLLSSNYDANTDFVGALPANTFSYTSTIFGLIPHATSSATASVASMWVDGLVSDKWVRISR